MLSTVFINLNCVLDVPDGDLSKSTLIPHADSMLSSLSNQYINIVLVTEHTQADTDNALQNNNIVRYINIAFFDTDIAGIEDILEEINVSKNEALLIDNTEIGLKNASKAGIATIAYHPTNISYNSSYAFILVEGYDEIDFEFINEQFLRANNLPVTILTTHHLVIRELTPLDIYELHKIYQKPGACTYIEPMNPDVNEEVLKHISYMDKVYNFYGYGLWGVFLKDSDKLIGRCGIQNKIIDDEIIVELGYLIDPDYQQQGYAFEATSNIINSLYDRYGIDTVHAIIDKENLPSINLALKLSMETEKEIIYNGKKCLLFHLNFQQ